MKQYRSWLLIVGLAGVAGTHCATETSDESASTADAVGQYEQALAGATVSLAQAIANAKAKHPEGTLQDARFVPDAVSPWFEVDLTVGNTVLEGRIDPTTGEVRSWGADGAEEAEEGGGGEAAEGEPSERVPCDRAIGAAEAAGHGRAVEIADDGSWFGVRVYGGGELHDVDVDAQGRVGGIRRIEWGNRGRGPRPNHGGPGNGAGGDGAGPAGPWPGQGGEGAGARGGGHPFPGAAGSRG